jgi:SulP family sulfate permease
MICVVSLSSSLDIAAIEIELRRPLDYNHELRTVGLSNIVSGLTGGYTGSYIFSQSIFSLKMGIRSRLMGFSLGFFILVFWMIPINLLSYVPNFFFGSLLLMICLDLMFEWLIDVRRGITRAEYATVLSTFALLQMLGLEFGIVAGWGLHVAMVRLGFDMGNDEKMNEDDMALANYRTTYE